MAHLYTISKAALPDDISKYIGCQCNGDGRYRWEKSPDCVFYPCRNSGFEEDVDTVSSASLMKENGELAGNSQLLAAMGQNAVGGDMYPIWTEKKYPSSYADTTGVAKKKMDSGEDARLFGELSDMGQYDTVVPVYLLWWGTITNAVKTFIQAEDMSGKTMHT